MSSCSNRPPKPVVDYQRIRADRLERTVEFLATKVNRLTESNNALRAANERLHEELAQVTAKTLPPDDLHSTGGQ